MPKGYFLDKWFKIADSINAEMLGLFTKNNLRLLELNKLPEEDRQTWYSLKSKSDRVSDKICKLILN